MLVFLKEDRDTARSLMGSDKERLYLEGQGMVTETLGRFQGFFQVDSLGVSEFRDGLSISSSFYEIDEAGNPRIYDVTYLIFNSGEIFEVLYYGDNFSAIDYHDYILMFETFYIGPVSEIPVGAQAEQDTGIYVNDEFGFSLIPPDGWEREDLNTTAEFFPGSQSANAITLFSPRDFQGFSPPRFVIMHLESEERVDLGEWNGQESIGELMAGLEMGLGEADTYEIINVKDEHFEHSVKTSFEILMRLDVGGTYLELNAEMILWMFDSGDMFLFLLFVDPVDYEDSIAEFRNSVGSATFKPRPEPEPTEARGGGCLVATAAYGTEMAPQVQMLREIRDGSLLQTGSGRSFVDGFNGLYYSFSPAIADYERENPVFREAVKLTITPLLASLSILSFVDVDSEGEVLFYGTGIILINVGTYLGLPAVVVLAIRKTMTSNTNQKVNRRGFLQIKSARPKLAAFWTDRAE